MANSAIPFRSIPGSSGGGSGSGLTANRFKTLIFDAAPAPQEFGVAIGAGAQPVVIRGDMNAAQIKTAFEASSDLSGYTVAVKGSTTAGTALPDGTLPYSGTFTVFLTGEAPYPAWGVVKNSEVQSFVVTDGDSGNYTLNGGANFTMGASAADLQANQRALAGNYAAVVVKGQSSAASNGGFDVSGAGDNSFNGRYEETGSFLGKPKYTKVGGGRWIYIASDTTAWFMSNDEDEGSATLRYYVAYSGATVPLTGWHKIGLVADPAPELSVVTSSISSGKFSSYFPLSSGNVADPTATGTGADASTVTQGGSDSTIVETGEVSVDELLWGIIT